MNHNKLRSWFYFLLTAILLTGKCLIPVVIHAAESETISKGLTGHFLYVATPGIRDYLGYGGHGLVVLDVDNHHQFVKRIPTQGFHKDGRPANVKGVAVSKQLNSIYITTLYALQRIDLATENIVWEMIKTAIHV